MGTEKYVLGLFIDKQRGSQSLIFVIWKRMELFSETFYFISEGVGLCRERFPDPGGQGHTTLLLPLGLTLKLEERGLGPSGGAK